MRIEEILGKSGVQFEYVIEVCHDTAEGQLLKNVRAVIDEYEREKILERINRGKRLAVKGGQCDDLRSRTIWEQDKGNRL